MDTEILKMGLLYEEIDTTVQHNRTYPEIPKDKKKITSITLHDFLTSKQNLESTKIIIEYMKFLTSNGVDLTDPDKLGMVMWNLYSFAELAGYRAGLRDERLKD